MKKNFVTSALLAPALITAAAPMHAAQEKQESNIQKAKKLVSESIARLKRCIKGNCSRMEALKVARDVTFAVIALYAAGSVSRRARIWGLRQLPPAAVKPALTLTRPIGIMEEAAMTPGLMVQEAVEQVTPAAVKAKARRVKYRAIRKLRGQPYY